MVGISLKFRYETKYFENFRPTNVMRRRTMSHENLTETGTIIMHSESSDLQRDELTFVKALLKAEANVLNKIAGHYKSFFTEVF